jgi:hypothetical protein
VKGCATPCGIDLIQLEKRPAFFAASLDRLTIELFLDGGPFVITELGVVCGAAQECLEVGSLREDPVRNTFASTSASWRRARVDSSSEAASPRPHADRATAAMHAIPKSSTARTIEDTIEKDRRH